MRTVGYIPSETEAAETTNAGGKPPIPEGGGTGTQKTDTGSGTAITATDTAVETPSTDHGNED